ncbi:MSHA biogenesis protein MshQ [Vibrio metoecus]
MKIKLYTLLLLLFAYSIPAFAVPLCSDIFTDPPSQNHSPNGLVPPSNLPSLGNLNCNGSNCGVWGPGDYQYNSGTLSGYAVSVASGKTARLYFNTLTISDNTYLNTSGDAENLIIYVSGSLVLNGNLHINGILYVAGSVTISANSTITGAIATGGGLANSGSTVVDLEAVELADFNGMCQSDKLVARYHLDESAWAGNTGEVKNTVANALHGVAVNGANTANQTPALPADIDSNGTCGYGVFNQSQAQYVNIPNDSALNFKDAFTISVWVYPKSYPNSDLMTIVSKDGNYEFHLDSQGRVYWYWERDTGAALTLTSTSSIPRNQWSHITIRYDRYRGSERQAIFINGQLNKSSNTNYALLNNNFPLQIGTDLSSASRAFNGYIDELSIYGSGLSNSKIAQLAQLRHSCQQSGLQCFSDDFSSPSLSDQWRVFKSSGNFTPSIVSQRLRLTEAKVNQATASTFQRIFPAAGNRVELEFDYFAHGGNGADGIAIVFSDAQVTPQVGAFGGPLGYGYKNNEQKPGFAGGWLGIGLDEYGNYSIEGGGNGPGARRQSVVLRGSGAGYSGYNYLAGTCANGTAMNPNGTCLSPAVDGTNGSPQHRYQIIIDSTQASTSMVTVRRKIGTGAWSNLIGPLNVMNFQGQESVPNELIMSITGSTGSYTNYHEIDNFQVCALNSRPVGEQINHFRLILPSNGLTCGASDVVIQACADASCSSLFADPVSANLVPASTPNADGGWVGGYNASLTNGVGTKQLRRNTAGRVTVDISGSTPTAQAYNENLCSRTGAAGSFSKSNCYIDFADSGFIVDVPNAYANQTVTATLKAVRKDNASQQCLPSFQNVQKSVAFWSDYLNPSSGSAGFNALSVGVNGTNVGQSANNAQPINLTFDQNGTAAFTVSYREAGNVALNARFTGSGDEQDLLLEGQDSFIRVPRALVLSAKSFYNSDGKCSAADMSCNVFARADENFDLNIRAEAVAADPVDDSDDLTIHNYQQANITLQHTLVEPEAGVLGVLGTNQYTHQLGEMTKVTQKVSEVGVFDFSLVAPTHYLGLDLASANLPIAVSSTGSIGRFIPAYFAVSPMTVSLDAACKTGNAFSYLGQPFEYSNSPGLYLQPKSANNADTQNYLIGSWWRYNNQWSGRTYSDSANGVNLGFDNQQTSPVSRQASNNSGIVLNGEKVWYQKPLQPKAVFNAAFDLTLNASNLTDQDGVCYRQNAASPCLGYTFSHIDGAMPLYWGKLVIQDVYGPETQPLDQPIYIEHYTTNGFVRTTDDSCTGLPDITGFTLPSSDYTVLTSGVPVPPQILAEHPSATLNRGQSAIRFSAPGAGVRGVIDSVLDLNAHNLLWLAEDKDGDGSFDQTTQGRVQFGLYRGSDRVIWWRESN